MKKTLVLYCLFLGIVSSSFSQSSFQVKVSGSGPAILLIPGLASSGEVWNETIAELSKTNECHVLTLAGFAGQPAIDLSAGFLPKMKVDIAEYLEEINKPVTLIGHSLGGFLSLQLANEYPSLISKAVIIDSYPFYSAGMNPAATAEMMVPMAKQTKTMLLNASNEDFEKQQEAGMSMMTATQSRVPQLVDWSMKSDRATFAEVLYELMTTDYRSNLATLNTPTLVLGAWYSAKDYGLTAESVKANFQLQYKFASNVQVEMAPTAYHFIMWDNPEWFMAQIQNFLK